MNKYRVKLIKTEWHEFDIEADDMSKAIEEACVYSRYAFPVKFKTDVMSAELMEGEVIARLYDNQE